MSLIKKHAAGLLAITLGLGIAAPVFAATSSTQPADDVVGSNETTATPATDATSSTDATATSDASTDTSGSTGSSGTVKTPKP